MKKNRQILLTCIISIFSLLILYFALSTYNSTEEYTVYLLTTDVYAGSAITSEMLRATMISKDVALPNAVLNTGELTGKVLMRSLKSGDILSVNDLGSQLSGIEYTGLTDGMELYSVSLRPENANGWWLYEGNRINLYVCQLESVSYDSQDTQGSDLIANPSDGVIVLNSIRIMRIMNE
ncbi:MAG: SAF domain-containing protein, partial [Saccharofermentanales bacterium]